VADLIWKGRQKGQHDFLCDMAPGWTLYEGGLGSGKTWAAARKLLVMHALNCSPSLVLAPTYGDLWRFVVPELQRAADEWGAPMNIHALGSGDERYCHIETLGNVIYLLSADTPKRIAGFEVGLVWIDEGARVKTDNFNPTNDAPTQARGRLRHKKARVLQGMISTTPEGIETWVQRDWHESPKPEHRAYRGLTHLNDTLPESYVSSLRSALGHDLATQYLEGVAVNYSRDRAHTTFSRAMHVKPVAVDPGRIVHVGCDFNVRPMCWVIAQVNDDGTGVNVLDEIVITDNAQVDGAVHAMVARGWDKRYRYVVHPDRSSKRRSTVGDPEIHVLTTTATGLGLTMDGNAYGVNPPVDARVNLLCRMLLDAAGKAHMTIDPRCTKLIDDLEKTGRGPNGYLPGPNGDRGHILDALGYLCFDLFRPYAVANPTIRQA
jgi:hypothetical protein